MKYARYFLSAYLMLSLASCGGDNDESSDVLPQPPADNRTEVSIITRTIDGVQTTSVLAGLYMVNWHDSISSELLSTGNYVNNQLLTWADNGWITATPIYWNDAKTKADFYAYAPYQTIVADARALPFSVETDQTTADAFFQSDFLWGKVEEKSPTLGGFDLTLAHVLSQLTVTVTTGAGFETDELQADDITITFGGSKTEGSIDLATGIVTVSGEANDVAMFSCGDLTYKAVLLPQQVPYSNLIMVNWQGNVYTLQSSYTLEAARQYDITVSLKKTKSGFDIGIAGWDIIGEDYGGTIGDK